MKIGVLKQKRSDTCVVRGVCALDAPVSSGITGRNEDDVHVIHVCDDLVEVNKNKQRREKRAVNVCVRARGKRRRTK